MPIPTSTSSQGSDVLTNVVKDQNPGSAPVSQGEMIALGVAGVGAVGLLWWASSRGASLHPARDPRYHRRRHHGRRR